MSENEGFGFCNLLVWGGGSDQLIAILGGGGRKGIYERNSTLQGTGVEPFLIPVQKADHTCGCRAKSQRTQQWLRSNPQPLAASNYVALPATGSDRR